MLACSLLLLACGAGEPEARVAPSPSAPPPAKVSDAIEVAITVDDLPRYGGDLPGASRVALHEKMLSVFAKHDTPPVFAPPPDTLLELVCR